jgi:hypothetical protein
MTELPTVKMGDNEYRCHPEQGAQVLKDGGWVNLTMTSPKPKKPSAVVWEGAASGYDYHELSYDCECNCPELYSIMDYLDKLQELNPNIIWPNKL